MIVMAGLGKYYLNVEFPTIYDTWLILFILTMPLYGVDELYQNRSLKTFYNEFNEIFMY